MLFQELKRLACTDEVARDLTPEGYARKPVRYVVQLDREGRFVGLVDQAGDDPRERRGKRMVVPDAVRSSAIRPLLLADKPEYVFGVGSGEDSRRARVRREAFLSLVRDCANETGRPDVAAVLRFLEAGEVPGRLDPSADVVTFEVEDRAVVDDPTVRAFWADHERKSRPGGEMECLVCGRRAMATEVWPVLIKRIPGGQTSGNQLVSANVAAFESYGLSGSQTSPACLDCAAEIGKALNWLLERDRYRLFMPASAFVFWTRGERTFDPVHLVSAPDPADVEQLMRAPWTGERGATALPARDFFAAELGASGSRVVVRSWIESTIPVVSESLRRYFQWQAITAWDGARSQPLPLRALVGATGRRIEDAPPFVAQDLIRVALTGAPAPARLLDAALRRARLERRVTTPRAALMKLTLQAGTPIEEDNMIELDGERADPAYLCGRLLAELEAAQRAAQGAATLSDRFYGAASSSPATVFGPLLRNAQHHLAKLRRDRPGAYHAIDGRLIDILERLNANFPALLTMRDQALFGLGFYHQKAADRAAARTRRDLAVIVDGVKDEEEVQP
jgi:CRISPR-associated protein Csd1